MVGNAVVRAFLLPGNVISDLLHVREEDSRVMVRTLINMLFWNLVTIVAIYAWLR